MMEIFKQTAKKTNQTEAEVIELIYRIVENIGRKYTFGHHDLDDIKQEAIFMAADGLKNFDTKAGTLVSFLYVHLGNRLFSFRRTKFYRGIIDCKFCKNEGCSKCEKRHMRMQAKKNIVEPLSTTDKEYCGGKNVTDYEQPYDHIVLKEYRAIIDKNLPNDYRPYYLKMLDGVSVPAVKRREIEQCIIEILDD